MVKRKTTLSDFDDIIKISEVKSKLEQASSEEKQLNILEEYIKYDNNLSKNKKILNKVYINHNKEIEIVYKRFF
ncbi:MULTISPECIES: hypothetical protein [Caloramator]|uniref:Uncharacterized protein n=1 Tax=Caloramator proteoclasticus DSM 10124 TaxID=1121262 RepID=A0A1M4UMZ8_9CLOT|nr:MULTISPECIES: hypothetical protein [Caloramator]SHE58027.1 hypothetical protein SAMN02746091_00699 [Caloramator proteoclasticus DSM 10124]